MHVYLYRAALYCETCGQAIREKLDSDRPAHINPDNESSFDSDEYPKGPYTDGGGEADCPQHCDACGTFLENPLTAEGVEYVAGRIADSPMVAACSVTTLHAWREFYAPQLAERRR